MMKSLLRPLNALLLATLLLSGCSANEGVTPLMLAAKEGDEQEVVRLLDEGARVNKQSQYGWTALIFASHYGHIDIVKRLLEHNADINHVSREIPTATMATRGGYDSTTALGEAIRQSHLNLAHLLLDSGARASYEALNDASASGDISLVGKMLKQGLSVNDIPEQVGRGSPLNSAAQASDVAMIRYLIDQGAAVNLRTWADNTPLTSAIKSFNPDAVKLLLEEGADPNLPRSRVNIGPEESSINSSKSHLGNAPPLYEAVRSVGPLVKTQLELNNMYRILELLFQYGADDEHWQSKKYQEYIAIAEKAIVRNLEWSQEQGTSKEDTEKYKAKAAYWRKVLALLKKEQTSPSKQTPVAT